MKEAKPTPLSLDNGPAFDNDTGILDGKGGHVAQVFNAKPGSEHYQEEQAELARLFAAAPDLLAAAELALRAVADPADWNLKARPALMAAIAKAKGGDV